MNRITILLAFLIITFSFDKASAQDKLYSFFGQYLVKAHEIDSAIYHVKKIKSKEETVTNYYVSKLDTFHLKTTDLIFLKFGSYTDHVRPHLALLKASNIEENCIIDCSDIQSDIKSVFEFLNTFSVGYGKEFERVKTGIALRVVKSYPDYPYWRRH